MSDMHMSEAASIINGVAEEKEVIIDLKVGRTQDYPFDDTIDDKIVIEEQVETFRASFAQNRYLDAPRSPFTEIVGTVAAIDLRTELTADFNSPDFDVEQSRYEFSTQLLNRLFDTYEAENYSTPMDNMEEEPISERIINQCNDALKNITDNPVILSTITRASSQIQSQSNNE